MKIVYLILIFTLFWSGLAFCQKSKNQTYYTISPDGLYNVVIAHDTVTVQRIFNYPKYTDVQSRSLALDIKRINDAHCFLLQNFYNKYETGKIGRKNLFIIKDTPDDQVVQFLAEELSFNNIASFSNAKYDLESKFYYSGYSSARMKEFGSYRKITSLDSTEIKKFVLIYNKEVLDNSERIKNTNTRDMYGTIVSRELINRALVRLKIDPNVEEDILFKVIGKYMK